MPAREDLRRLNDELDERVQVRTAELTAANERLAAEIRQREEAEAEIRRLNSSLEHRVSELQTLFEFIPIGVGIAKDVDCRVIQMNPALATILDLPAADEGALAGVPLEPAPPYRVLRRGVPLESHQLPMQLAARENQPVLDFEMTIERNDGVTLEILVSAVPLRDRTGHARGCVATFQDITQRKRTEQERLDFERRIQETQKLESLGVLSGGIAHDFNNLLTGVLGHANLARFSLLDGQESVSQALDQIERSAQRAAELCKQLLAYAGKGRFHVQALNLSRLVEEMSHLLVLSITQKASLVLRLADDLPLLMGDATQLRQVVMNLVINAAEAMPNGRGNGSIVVRTSRVRATSDFLQSASFPEWVTEADYLELEVSDNGVGMSDDIQARIFDPFFTTKFTGRGLGLAAVLGIVRSHRGAIRVTSQPDHGTTFKLLFPAAPDAILSPPPPPPELSTWRGHGTALVIDDEETVRNVAQRALEQLGFDVVLASDGLEGLEKFRSGGPYTIVLLDLTMPRLDGEHTLRALHAAEAALPILLMSGFNEQATVERFVGRGLAGFIPKPFTVDLLAQRVREALEKTAV
jgi:two-component system, cell cycle sensor histidine kinase and response regulator CckA